MEEVDPGHAHPGTWFQIPWTVIMNLRQYGILPPSTALWASTQAMQSQCLGHSVLGQLQLGLSS